MLPLHYFNNISFFSGQYKITKYADFGIVLFRATGILNLAHFFVTFRYRFNIIVGEIREVDLKNQRFMLKGSLVTSHSHNMICPYLIVKSIISSA